MKNKTVRQILVPKGYKLEDVFEFDDSIFEGAPPDYEEEVEIVSE